MRRSTRFVQARAAAIILVSLSLFASGFPDGVSAFAPDLVEGTVSIDHGDRHPVTRTHAGHGAGGEFDPAGATYTYFVETRGGERVKIIVPGKGRGLALAPGQMVRLRGTRSGGPRQPALELAAGDASVQVLAEPTAPAPVMDKRVAVVLVNFTADTRTPWTTDQVRTSIFGTGTSTSSWFAQASQAGIRVTGDVFGWNTINADLTTCAYREWATAANAVATSRGVDLTAYTNIQYVFPSRSVCGWAGLATVGGTNSWLNGTISVGTSAHELGHNFGLHHANAYRCTADGVAVPLSTSCTSAEYGDPFDNMGSSDSLAHAWHRIQMRAMPADSVQTVTAAGSYSVRPLYGTDGPRLLRIARPGDTVNPYLYIDFRQPTGVFDTWSTSAAIVNGVVLRVGSDTSIRQTQLVDTVPATTTFADAPLLAGRSVHDPISGATITVTSVSTGGATVGVTFNAPGALASPVPTAAPVPPATSSPAPTAAPTTGPTAVPTPTPTATPVPTAQPVVTPPPTPSPTAITDVLAPSAPGGLRATVQRSKQVDLAWTASVDNVRVTGYRVYRGATLVATVATTTFRDRMKLSGSVTYSVRAIDAAGNVSAAVSVTAAVPSKP